MSETGATVLDREDLRHTVAQVLDIEPSDLADLMRLEDVGGDSLLALEVIVVLEGKYGVRFDEAELRAFTSLSSIHDLLAVKLGAL
ncbi:acyl carrier protein [Streptomyces huasconensis]|uniref:acyl carrier protein n=1 Tax=Streptomyces huasconensis TaxID=1854574 RepID=UPI0033F3A7FE